MTKQFFSGLAPKPNEPAFRISRTTTTVKKVRKPKFQSSAHTKGRNDHWHGNGSQKEARASQIEHGRRQGDQDP